MSDSPTMKHPQFDVAIVGAGLAGLATADELMKRRPDLKVCVLEARERAGGRTETLSHLGIDIGAQWIGPTHTEMLALAERFKLELSEQFYPSAQSTRLTECVGYDQAPLTSSEAANVQRYIALIEELSKDIDVNAPWRHSKAKEFDNISVTDHVTKVLMDDPAAQKEILLFVQTVLACSPHLTSFLFFLFYVKSGGGMEALGDGDNGAQKYKAEGGIQQISTLLLGELMKKHQVQTKFSFAVRTCDHDEAQKVTKLVSSDGDCVTCQRVVFAVPPQLIARKIAFHPPLSEGKQALGENLTPGHAVKIIAQFNEAFWLENQNRSNKTQGSLPHFTEQGPVHNLFHATLNGKHALVGLVTGEAATAFGVLEHQQDRKKLVMNQLTKMYFGNQPSADQQPVFYADKVWSNEEWSGGCFAGICPANGSLFKYGEYLRRPELNSMLFFCSTETSPEFYGYMEGAVRSGRRVAKQLLSSFE